MVPEELPMKCIKNRRRTVRQPLLRKLNLKAKGIDPTLPVPETQHPLMKNLQDSLEVTKPVQFNGGQYGKHRRKARKMFKPPVANVTVARRKVGTRVINGRKRKLQVLYSEIRSEYSFTDGRSPSDDSMYSTSGTDSNYSDFYDRRSSTLDDGSEYYYTNDSQDYCNDGSSSYDDSNSEASTRKGFAWDAPNRQLGLWQSHPVYGQTILGKGSFAVVYLSYSKANKKYFAVKCANGCRLSTLKSLTREADILKKLNSPYLIEYLGECRVPVTLKADRTGTRPKPVPMVTEIYLPYIKRGTLADLIRGCIRKKRMMEESVIRNYTKQILRGLRFLHSNNIVHCDLKGANILVGKTHLKISDFGCSKHVIPTENRRLISRAGTRAWMAPEVRMRVEQGFPADVWSLGCTVVQMITGKPPVAKGLLTFLQWGTTTERPDAVTIPKDFKRLSTECIDLLRKCFLKDPKARWTCQQLLGHPFLKVK